jgi:tetratricopeptide (TPR) repeat protein
MAMSFSALLRTSAGLVAAATLVAACGQPAARDAAAGADKDKPSVAAQADALSAKPTGDAKSGEEDTKELGNVSQELLDKLKTTDNDEEAARLEEEIWDAWLVSGSGTVDILMKRGLEYQEQEDIEGAREMFDRVIAIRPEYAEGWNRRALLFFNDGKYDEAVADLESTLLHEPRHFGAWIGLGMIFESIERPEAALLAYRKALEVHPNAAAAKQGEKRLIRIVEGVPL